VTRLRSTLLTVLAALPLLALHPAAAAGGAPARSFDRSAAPAGARRLDWLAFDAAAARASKEGKHVIVDIYTTWCGWCKVMERQTYGDSEVANYITRNFVLAKVNGESSAKMHWKGQEMTEREFTRMVGVTGFPTTFFFKPDLDVVGGVPGFIRPHDFMIYARYVGTRWYEKGNLQDFMKEQQARADSAR
jgi:thioredoxin-related protein